LFADVFYGQAKRQAKTALKYIAVSGEGAIVFPEKGDN
jgi:hypothetical protein